MSHPNIIHTRLDDERAEDERRIAALEAENAALKIENDNFRTDFTKLHTVAARYFRAKNELRALLEREVST